MRNSQDTISKQFRILCSFINVVLQCEPQKTSEEVKRMFIAGCEQGDRDTFVGWKNTGYTEDAFHSFWEIAWREAPRQN